MMKSADYLKIRTVIAIAAFGLLLFPAVSSLPGEEAGPVPSYRYIVVYGSGELQVGDMVDFFDLEGTLCGRWVVQERGGYGLTAVYGDDPRTEIDEGARPGEFLSIRVNGREVLPVGGPPLWENEGQARRIDL